MSSRGKSDVDRRRESATSRLSYGINSNKRINGKKILKSSRLRGKKERKLEFVSLC